MNSELIPAFIASGFAVFTSIINIVVSTINAQKNSNIRVIVETRINYMQKLRSANAVFIGLANPNLIIKCLNNNELIFNKEFAESIGMLKTLLKPFYPIERRMVELINTIENNIILLNNEKDKNLLENIKTDVVTYIKLFNQYDWVYWQYIMRQADGKYRNSNIDFDNMYEETKIKYIKEYDYDWI